MSQSIDVLGCNGQDVRRYFQWREVPFLEAQMVQRLRPVVDTLRLKSTPSGWQPKEDYSFCQASALALQQYILLMC